MKLDDFTLDVEQHIEIKAPPEKIFNLINDFHNWLSWSPWEKMDPALKRTYSGAAAGKGAVYEWEGNKKVGQGRMERVRADIKFLSSDALQGRLSLDRSADVAAQYIAAEFEKAGLMSASPKLLYTSRNRRRSKW